MGSYHGQVNQIVFSIWNLELDISDTWKTTCYLKRFKWVSDCHSGLWAHRNRGNMPWEWERGGRAAIQGIHIEKWRYRSMPRKEDTQKARPSCSPLEFLSQFRLRGNLPIGIGIRSGRGKQRNRVEFWSWITHHLLAMRAPSLMANGVAEAPSMKLSALAKLRLWPELH